MARKIGIGLLIGIGLSVWVATGSDRFDQHMKAAGDRLRAKDYAAAVPILQAALALEPYSVVAHDALGVAYSQLGQYTLAVQEFKTALQIDPKLALTHNNLGFLYLELRRLDEAAAEFEQALQIDPGNDTAYTNLGRVYAAQNRLDQAAQAFAAALRRNPKNAEARQALSRLGRRDPEPPAAREPAPAAARSPGYKVIVTDPTQVLSEAKALSYYPVGPTATCLLERDADQQDQTLSFEVWLLQPEAKGHLYWSFVPEQPGVRRAPVAAATPRVSKSVSGVRLVSAGPAQLVWPKEARQCYLSASQPLYITRLRWRAPPVVRAGRPTRMTATGR